MIENLKKEIKAKENTNKMEDMEGTETSQLEEPLQNVDFATFQASHLFKVVENLIENNPLKEGTEKKLKKKRTVNDQALFYDFNMHNIMKFFSLLTLYSYCLGLKRRIKPACKTQHS